VRSEVEHAELAALQAPSLIVVVTLRTREVSSTFPPGGERERRSRFFCIRLCFPVTA
jgi:hypothetical protein